MRAIIVICAAGVSAQTGVPTQGKSREFRRLAISDKQAERERVGERDDLQLARGRPLRAGFGARAPA